MVAHYLHWILLQSLCLLSLAIPQSKVWDGPKFSSELKNTTVVAGREARLGCTVENLQNYKVAWVHYGTTGSAVLTVGTHVLTTNNRVSVLAERDTWFLIIANTTVKDRGEYMCQISTVPPKKIYGTLQVQVPPHISHPPNDVTVEEGNNVTLECDATGDPFPQITWRREDKGNILVNGEKEWTGRMLSLYHVTRNDARAFLCVASNGVPPAVSARVEVFVLYPPIISNDPVTKWAVKGSKTDLICEFRAFPRPTVQWSRVRQRENQEFEVRTELTPGGKGTSRLTFQEVRDANFGSYKCLVENRMGKAEQDLFLFEKITTTTATTTTTTKMTRNSSSSSVETTTMTSLRKGVLNFSKNISIESIIRRYLGNHSLTIQDDINFGQSTSTGESTNRMNVKKEAKEPQTPPPDGTKLFLSNEGERIAPKIGDTKAPKRFRQESPLDTRKLRPFSSDSSNEAISTSSQNGKCLLTIVSTLVLITSTLITCTAITCTKM